MAFSPDLRQSSPWVCICRHPEQEAHWIQILTFLRRSTEFHEGWVLNSHPFILQPPEKPSGAPHPSLNQNDDKSWLNYWIQTATQGPCCHWLHGCQAASGLSTSNPTQDLPWQTGRQSETPPELLTETRPFTAVHEAAFMKRHGQALPGPSVPPCPSVAGLHFRYFPSLAFINRKA